MFLRRCVSGKASFRLLWLPRLLSAVYTVFVLPSFLPASWNVLEMLVKPTCSMIYLWGIMKIVGFTNISNNFHDSRNYGSPEVFPDSWEWLKMLVSPILSAGTYFKTVLTVTETCDSADLTYSCEVFCKQAGKVFASLKKLTSWSNTKLGNNLHLQTLLWEHQFMFFFLFITYKAILHV